MGLARKRITAIVTLLVLFSFLTVYIASTSTSQAFPTQKATDETTTLSSREVLAGLDLTDKFEYRRQCIKPRQRIGLQRASYTNLTGSFLVEPVELDSRKVNDEDSDGRGPAPLPPCSRTITVDVPATDKEHTSGPETDADTSSLMLGMATTLSRLLDSLPEMARWLSDTGSHLIVILLDQDRVGAEDPPAKALALAKTLHVQLTLFPYTAYPASPAERTSAAVEKSKRTRTEAKLDEDDVVYKGKIQTNFGLAQAFMDKITVSTKWLAIVEDDTFFLSLPAMLRALRPHDPTKQVYIGASSERATASSVPLALSGAGIFLSIPLARILAANTETCLALPLPNLPPSSVTSSSSYISDTLWRDCIYALTAPTVQLTPLPGLHPLDIHPDVSAWYESGTWPVLTLHDWKTRHVHPVPVAHLVVDVAGPASFLGRWAWRGDSSSASSSTTESQAKEGGGVILTNGYSLVQYPRGIPDLRLVERTMASSSSSTTTSGRLKKDGDEDVDAEYRFSLGRLRPKLEDGVEKRSWRLEHAVSEGGSVRQFYVRRARPRKTGEMEGAAAAAAMDSVIEIDWIR